MQHFGAVPRLRSHIFQEIVLVKGWTEVILASEESSQEFAQKRVVFTDRRPFGRFGSL